MEVVDLQRTQAQMENQVLIIKFGADWCGPCKRISPAYYEFIRLSPANILFADIDVDDNINLYGALKKAKMVNSIPVFLAFYSDTKRDQWYIPDDSIIGADPTQVGLFFNRCLMKATSQIKPGAGTGAGAGAGTGTSVYTYYT